MVLGPKTKQNLLDAFAGESQANRKYTAFARVADAEGYPEIAELFRSIGEGETAHALGHLERLAGVGSTAENLQAAIDGETYETEDMYPRMVAEAREEGHEDIAQWFELVGQAEKAHAARYKEALKKVQG
jgi:rubrerythrin